MGQINTVYLTIRNFNSSCFHMPPCLWRLILANIAHWIPLRNGFAVVNNLCLMFVHNGDMQTHKLSNKGLQGFHHG